MGNTSGYSLLSKLADQSTAYLLLTLAIIALIFFVKYILDEKDKEIHKGEEMNVVLRAVNDTQKELVIEIERMRNEEPYDKKRKK